MRIVALVLLTTGSVCGVGFCIDYIIGLRHRIWRPNRVVRAREHTARDILISAAGITLLVLSFLLDALVDWPGRWVLAAEVGALASAMFPPWWRRMRRLRREYRDYELVEGLR